MKIVINTCFGGFGLSEKAKKRLGIQYDFDIDRNDPNLVKVVEELGGEANDRFAQLKVVDVPDDVQWIITDYDGIEQVEEVHRIWR